MSDQFPFDVFLSHSSKDKTVVRSLAERLRLDGLKVWFDEWVLKPGDSIPAKVEEGLTHSRVLVLCMSANAFGSDWAQLEAGTFRFRDPLNQERRFIPLRLDDAPIKGSLAQFLYINWLPAGREREYAKLFAACEPPLKPKAVEAEAVGQQVAEKAVQLEWKDSSIKALAFSADGKSAIVDHGKVVLLWDVETQRVMRRFDGYTPWRSTYTVAWSADERHALSGGSDNTVAFWDVATGECLRRLEGHANGVIGVALSADNHLALSSAFQEDVLRLWDLETGQCLRKLKGHTKNIYSIAFSDDGRHAISGSVDCSVRLWDVKTGQCLRVLEGHTADVYSVALRYSMHRALSGSFDNSIRLWDLETGR